jgi:hypothetical protein
MFHRNHEKQHKCFIEGDERRADDGSASMTARLLGGNVDDLGCADERTPSASFE